MKENESKILPFPGRQADFQDDLPADLQKMFAKILPSLSEKDTSNQENIVQHNNFKENNLIDEEITVARKAISALEKKRGIIPVYILIPVIALCWGFAYAKFSNLMLSVPLLVLGLVLLRITQKNYDKVWCINQQIKKEMKKLE